MNKITNYFYIFSKLTTSLVLLLIVFLMGYALLKSYKTIDITNSNLEDRLISLESSIVQNNIKLSKIDNKLVNNDKIIDEIKKLNKDSIKNQELTNLLNLTKNLQNQLNELTLEFQNIDKFTNSELSNINQINSLYKLILIKYKNGENVDSEVLFLADLLLPNKKLIFEKLNLLLSKKFYGFEKLSKEFEISSNNFLKDNFKVKTNNSMITFLSKFIDIKLNNSHTHHNKDLNILIRAEKYMLNEDIKKSLNQILLIDENANFFSKWINQAKIYLEFINELAKVI